MLIESISDKMHLVYQTGVSWVLKIRTYNAISPIGLDRFSTEIYSISDHTDSADAIMLRSHKLAESEIGSQVLG